MARKKIKPIHPGEILEVEFLKPLGITKYRLAKDTHVAADRIGKIVSGHRAITADTALRFARFFGTSPEFWMNLQARYDLEITLDQHGREISRQVVALDRDEAA